ncbi:MAG: cystathionine beta-synthase, partial [Thalassobium sp.]
MEEVKTIEDDKMLNYIGEVLENMPTGWLNLTTHRLDIYDESLAKTQFLDQLEALCNSNNASASALYELPTAFDYIRLGHPLSCVLEWAIAKSYNTKANNVISFSSETTPILAVLRKNLLANVNTQINYTGELPAYFDADVVKNIYGYKFELNKVESIEAVAAFDGSSIFVSQPNDICRFDLVSNVDFYVNIHPHLGSILLVNGEQNENYVSEIQHVRRRETIAMTPVNSL